MRRRGGRASGSWRSTSRTGSTPCVATSKPAIGPAFPGALRTSPTSRSRPMPRPGRATWGCCARSMSGWWPRFGRSPAGASMQFRRKGVAGPTASWCSASRPTTRITPARSNCSSGYGRSGACWAEARAVADTIRQAGSSDVDVVAPLFDAYRQFYDQPSDPALARTFIAERLERGESVIFLAERSGRAIGFVQLYPLFSSTARRPRRLWLLNDLYVAPDARQGGVGRALMRRARQLAEETGACGLELATARTNTIGQQLYESEGYRLDDAFLRYELGLP